MKTLLLLALGTSLAFAQAKPSVSQEGGDCTVNTNGDNNTVRLVCNNLDPKLADQISAILKTTRSNEKATKEVSEKLDQILKQVNKEAVPPEVGLRFVYPKEPALVIVNQSDAIARNIKWMVELWNMDLPDRNDPLPILTSAFDWIRPHQEGGPQNLFGPPNIASLLKPGNRLFGSASVSCPECSRGRTYIVYIEWGQGGWVSEVEDIQTGAPILPEKINERKP